MAKTEGEIKRLKENLRNINSIITELEKQSDRSSQEELRRQKQLKAGIEAELDD